MGSFFCRSFKLHKTSQSGVLTKNSLLFDTHFRHVVLLVTEISRQDQNFRIIPRILLQIYTITILATFGVTIFECFHPGPQPIYINIGYWLYLPIIPIVWLLFVQTTVVFMNEIPAHANTHVNLVLLCCRSRQDITQVFTYQPYELILGSRLDNLGKQFEPRSGPTSCRSWSGCKQVWQTILTGQRQYKRWSDRADSLARGDFCRLQMTKSNSVDPVRTDRMWVLTWIQTVWHWCE